MSRADGHDDLYAAVGERIAEARHNKHMSQGKLAQSVGLTRASIVNIERGRQRTPIHLLWQLASVLEVEPKELIPLQRELTARRAPVQLDANVVAYIEQAAENDPATKRLLTDFIQKASSKRQVKNGPPEKSATTHRT
jgi:transcriptional regulator with XRE-family HTH domain